MSDMPQPLNPSAPRLEPPKGLLSYPPVEKWHDWVEYDTAQWPRKVEKHYQIIPTICFNCEAACGLLGFVDKETNRIRRFDGNPEHPGSRGRNCAKGPATLNQVTDPERIRYPLKRVGKRGEGKWERVSWDEALDDIAARVRKALQEDRRNEIMYHVGRPGHELLYHQRIFHAWGIDGHNSHTNVCSAGARVGYAFWSGIDRPSPDHANARFILLLSSHLETGHYFNPHAQRIIEAKERGARVCVIDSRLSNTASMADWWLAPWPGSESALLLAMASVLIRERLYDREFVRRWVNWEEYLREQRSDLPQTFEAFERALAELYARYTPEFAAQESGVSAATIVEVARALGRAGPALATHIWRNTAAGNLGGWQVARALELLVVLMGAVGTPGGTAPSAWNKAIPAPPLMPPPAKIWSELLMPREYPLAFFEMSYLLPHFLKEGRGKLAMYFTRVKYIALPEGGPREARDVLHARVQPGVDEPRWHVVARDVDRRGEGRAACVSDTDLERDGVVCRLRAADGPRLRAPRPHVAGDARRALDRLPPARAARRPREAGPDLRPHVAGARGCGARPGVGGGRVLDRALVAHRSGRRPRDPQVLRVALPGGRQALHRGALPLDLRAQRPGAPRGGRSRGAHAARVHAEVRRLPHRGPRLPHARAGGAGGGPRRRQRGPGDEGRREGRADGRRRGGRARVPGVPDALAQARVLLEDAQGLEVARGSGALLHP